MNNRITEATIADLGMAEELWSASPDGRAEHQRLLDSLGPTVTVDLDGTLTAEDDG